MVILEKSFEDVIFSENDHSYKINGERANFSVTQLIKKFEEPFEEKKMAKIVASKQGVLVEDIIQLWNFKKEFACFKGTLFHSYVENFLQKKRIPLNKTEIEKFVNIYSEYTTVLDLYQDVAKYISNFQNFYDSWKQTYILIKPELVVGDKKTKVCGCVDNLSYDYKNERLVIFDYKTNKELKQKSKSKMTGMLSHLDSNSITKYSLQMALYSEIIERNTPLKIYDNKIVWVGGSDGEVVNCLDLRQEARAMLSQIELDLL